MANLPIFQTGDTNLQLLQNSWKAAILPILNNEINQGILIAADLVMGDNVINHLLQRKPQGWIIADIEGTAVIYRSAAFNNLTLTLNSDADVPVKLWIF